MSKVRFRNEVITLVWLMPLDSFMAYQNHLNDPNATYKGHFLELLVKIFKKCDLNFKNDNRPLIPCIFLSYLQLCTKLVIPTIRKLKVK